MVEALFGCREAAGRKTYCAGLARWLNVTVPRIEK